LRRIKPRLLLYVERAAQTKKPASMQSDVRLSVYRSDDTEKLALAHARSSAHRGGHDFAERIIQKITATAWSNFSK
jgi:hypothetical protein